MTKRMKSALPNNFGSAAYLTDWLYADDLSTRRENNAARLSENIFLTEDGANLPYRHWLPKTDPHAILIALHGFNDYSRFFQQRASISANRVSLFRL